MRVRPVEKSIGNMPKISVKSLCKMTKRKRLPKWESYVKFPYIVIWHLAYKSWNRKGSRWFAPVEEFNISICCYRICCFIVYLEEYPFLRNSHLLDGVPYICTILPKETEIRCLLFINPCYLVHFLSYLVQLIWRGILPKKFLYSVFVIFHLKLPLS